MIHIMQVSVIIPAAGSGRRMGNIKKPYIALAGKPILAHTLAVFQECPLVDRVVIAVAAGDEQTCIQDVIVPYGMDKADQVVVGGETRQESVFNGLKKLSSDIEAVVLVCTLSPGFRTTFPQPATTVFNTGL